MKNAFRIGDRLYLRPVELADRDRYLQWINDPEVNRFLLRSFPVDEVAEDKWLRGVGEREDQAIFAVVLKDGNRHIGGCGLHHIGLPARRAELGILIGEIDCWNQGYGGEAIGLLLDYAFDRLGLHRVELNVYAYNRRGIRCYERSGFRFEGALREARFLDGQFHDILLYGILEHEYRARERGRDARLACVDMALD